MLFDTALQTDDINFHYASTYPSYIVIKKQEFAGEKEVASIYIARNYKLTYKMCARVDNTDIVFLYCNAM